MIKISSFSVFLTLGLILASASPVRADFFDDVDFALNKLGNAVADTVDSAIGSDKPASTPSTPLSQNPSQNAGFYAPQAAGSVAHTLPTKPPRAGTAAPSKASTTDDAPAPKAAPHRDPVQRVATLSAPLGASEAAPTYNPLEVQKVVPIAASAFNKMPYPKPRPTSLNAQQLAKLAPFMTPAQPQATETAPAPQAKPQPTEVAQADDAAAALPAAAILAIAPSAAPAVAQPITPAVATAPAKPAQPAVQPILLKNKTAPRSFAVRFDGLSTVISDELISAPEQPQPVRTLVISAAGKALATEHARVMLVASAYSVQGEPSVVTSSRAFDRAQAVRDWLVSSGLRPTQMDFTIVAPNPDNGPADKVDIIVTSEPNANAR